MNNDTDYILSNHIIVLILHIVFLLYKVMEIVITKYVFRKRVAILIIHESNN